MGDLCGGFVDVVCSMNDRSRAKIVVRKGCKIPVSMVIDDGALGFRTWCFPEFCPQVLPLIEGDAVGVSHNGVTGRRGGLREKNVGHKGGGRRLFFF